MFAIKRVYDAPSPDDGFRVLVDRLWPRGLSKEKAAVDLWLKDVAPSTELRTWFNHEPEKWGEFVTRYHAELKDNPAVADLRRAIKEHGRVTLLYGAHDEKHNQAVALRRFFPSR